MILRGLFKDDKLYVKLWENVIEVIDVEKGNSIKEVSSIPFSSSRLLIADFELAESFFKKVLEKLKRSYKLKRYNSFVVHPMEMTEGGVSTVEERILLESFERLNGRMVLVYEGLELNNQQVLDKLKGKRK